jgi:hypothetical protein
MAFFRGLSDSDRVDLISSMTSTRQTQVVFSSDTVKVVLDTVREEYLGQERRYNLLISKTRTLVAVGYAFGH